MSTSTQSNGGRSHSKTVCWSWSLPPCEKHGLPKGEVSVVIAPMHAEGKKQPKLTIQSVSILIPDREDDAERTVVYDRGAVVVDFDAAGRMVELELLALRKPSGHKGLLAAIHGRSEANHLLRAAFWTAHRLWHEVEHTLALAREETAGSNLRSDLSHSRPETMLKARPDTREWGQKGDLCNA